MIEQKISVKEENPNSFVVYDCTGKYSTPGYRISDIESSTLFIQKPSDTLPYQHSIDVTGSLPNDEGLGVEVLPSQAGIVGSEMEPGLYKFKLQTTFNVKAGVQKTVTSYHSCVIVKSLQCCIAKMISGLDRNAFKDLRQKKAIELSTLFVSVKYQIELGRYDQANTIIEYLKSQCKCPGC